MDPCLKRFIQISFCGWILAAAGSMTSFVYNTYVFVNRPPDEDAGTTAETVFAMFISLFAALFFFLTSFWFPVHCLGNSSRKLVNFNQDVQFRSRSLSLSDDSLEPRMLIVPDVNVVSRTEDSGTKGIVVAEVHHCVQNADEIPKSQVQRGSSGTGSCGSTRTQSTGATVSCSATGSPRSLPEEPGIEPCPDEDSEEQPQSRTKSVQLKSCLKEQPYARPPRRHKDKEGSGSFDVRTTSHREEAGSGSSEASTPRHRGKECSGSSGTRSPRKKDKEGSGSSEGRVLRDRSKSRKAESKKKRKSQ